MCRQIEVLVVYDLVPDTRGIHGETVGRDPSVVFGKEYAADEFLVLGRAVAGREAGPKSVNFGKELLGLEDLVRERGKGKVKVVVDLRVLESGGLGDGGPQFAEVLNQSVAKILERCVSDMITDDEEEERSSLRSGRGERGRQYKPVSRRSDKGREETHCLSFRNSCRLTSKTVFSSPMFAPWYRPT